MKNRMLVWAYFTMNTGDDLFLKVLFDRYPNVIWDLLTANRNYKEIFSDYKNVNIIYSYREVTIGHLEVNPFYKINDYILNYKKYDGLVYIGGSIFKQNKAWEFRFKEREYLLKIFKKMNKKVFIIGANFGPFVDNYFIEKYREIFEYYDDICFRDTYSYNLFNDLNNVRIAPDAVLCLGMNEVLKKEKSIGLSLIDIKNRTDLMEYYHHYNEKMVQIIKAYIGMGYKVKLFSFCEYEGDFESCCQVFKKIDIDQQENMKIIKYVGNLNSFLDEFKTCEIIIGARFHSVILAFLFNQSVFPIIYSEKTYNFLKDLGLCKHLCMIKDIDKLCVDEIIKNSITNKIKNKNIFTDANRHFEKLDMLLGEPKKIVNQMEETGAVNKLFMGNEVIK